MTIAQDLPPHGSSASEASAHIPSPRRWAPGLCVWCGDDDQIEVYGNEHRCATCRGHESAIAEARGFIRMYGLRPLGGSLDSEDEEEREYRVAARDARAALNAAKLADPPRREEVRKALSGSRTSAVERVESLDVDDGSAVGGHGDAQSRAGGQSHSPSKKAPKKASKTGQPAKSSRSGKTAKAEASPAKDVDLQTLEARVTTLLGKLSTIDEQIKEKSANGGLAAQARIKDLERQRDTVMHTLAALEKARRLQSG